jgi:lactate/malate dehydrogenase, NAD binding domain
VCDRVKVKDADYDGLEGAGLVLITSGVNEKTGGAIDRSDPEGRIKLLDQNAAIYREIVPKIVRAAPNAVLVDGSATAPGPRGALAAAETESREAHGRIKGFEGDRTQRTIARKPPHPARTVNAVRLCHGREVRISAWMPGAERRAGDPEPATPRGAIPKHVPAVS